MSRLIEKIKKQQEKTPVPIGFGRTIASGPKPSILLIARVTPDTGSPLKNIEGADAVLLENGNSSPAVKTLAKITKPLGDTPWGVFLNDNEDGLKALEEAGCDFAVLPPTSAVAITEKDGKPGIILQVDSAMDDGLLRAVNDLPVDGVLAADSFDESGTLTYHHLMILRHLAFLVVKPLLVPVPVSISKDELKALWDAGIEAVVVPVDIGKEENLKKLHEIAASLPPRISHKEKKVDVFLPRSGGKQPEPPEEEEEDE